MTEVLWGIVITGVFSLLVALINGYFKLKEKTKTLTKENHRIRTELSCLDILFNHQFVNTMSEKITEVFESTPANRFLMLFAVNGKTEMDFVTVFYENILTKKAKGASHRYVRLKVDHHYKEMLKTVERFGVVDYKVSDMPDCLLRSIYQSEIEQVKYSSVRFIRRIAIDEDNDVVIFSSIATTKQEQFTSSESAIIKAAYDVLRNESFNITIGQH